MGKCSRNTKLLCREAEISGPGKGVKFLQREYEILELRGSWTTALKFERNLVRNET